MPGIGAPLHVRTIGAPVTSCGIPSQLDHARARSLFWLRRTACEPVETLELDRLEEALPRRKIVCPTNIKAEGAKADRAHLLSACQIAPCARGDAQVHSETAHRIWTYLERQPAVLAGIERPGLLAIA